MKKVCVFIGSRANYSSIKSAMRAIDKHNDLLLQLIVGASAILDRYGSVIDLIKSDGFNVDAKVNIILENDSLEAMAKSTGLGIIEISTIFEAIHPDAVLIVGDRFEMLSAVLPASYMNIPIAHTMGGEISGTIDETLRHVITKFSNIHFPANQNAAERIIKMGEDSNLVFNVGCPRIDIVKDIIESGYQLGDSFYIEGVGPKIDTYEDFLMLSQHPVTTEYASAESNMKQTMDAVKQIGLPTIALWPNADAGTDGVSTAIRKFRERNRDFPIRFFKNIELNDYIALVNRAKCLIGNSSSGIRECAFIGVPVVNIGTRQNGRDRSQNVIDVGYCSEEIYDAVSNQINHGKYKRDFLYGRGDAGQQIADILSKQELNSVKRMAY